MRLQFALFFLFLAGALSGVALYVHKRTAAAFGIRRKPEIVLRGTLVSAVVLPFALRFAGWTTDATLDRTLAMLGFSVALTLLITTGFLLPIDAVTWLSQRFRKPSVTKSPAPDDSNEKEIPPLLTRRELLSRSYVGLALGTGASTSLYGITLGRHDYVIEQVPIPLRNLPRALDGYTIAQLSDIHVGMFVGERELEAGVELVRQARPDMIVLTGDLIDHDPRFIPALGRFCRRLSDLGVRDGVVAIPGNHDYYTGIDDVLRTLRAAGAHVLRNDARVIGDRGASFALLGVDDVWAGRDGLSRGADLDAALAQVSPDLTRVLLCHNPEFFPQAAPRIDLQLSGHTHGGQVNFIVRPADLVLRHGYIRGHYVRGESQIYVNRGFGTAGPPIRIGSPPEVSRIVLTSA
jgi:predicted MPP superfamily phosphohydrolase